MLPAESLNDLAIALEAFFKGLSECGLVTTYSVQLQIASVDFVLQIKYHCLVYQFMKTLQTLLMKTSIPGHESCRDIGIQTSDFNSVSVERKQSATIYNVSSEFGSLVEASMFSKPESDINWIKEDNSDQNMSLEHNKHNIPTDIVVTCHPATLAVVTGPDVAETITENNNKNFQLSCNGVDNFRIDSGSCQQNIMLDSSSDEVSLRENANSNLNSDKRHVIELDSNEPVDGNEQINCVEIKHLESEVNPLILKAYVKEELEISDNLNVMHILVASDNSVDKASVVEKDEKDQKRLLKCKKCDKTLPSVQSLNIHLTRKHNAKEQCDMCSKSFSSIQSLQEHCRMDHGGIGCFNCLVCSRRFMTKLSYKRHMDTHVGKKEAVCDMCGKTFSRADYLTKHYMTHSGAKPISCSLCPRKFVSTSHLKNHEKTHTGEREHLCKLCPKSFSRADKLKEHTLRHLNIKKFSCSKCKRSYAEKRDLKKHMLTHDK